MACCCPSVFGVDCKVKSPSRWKDNTDNAAVAHAALQSFFLHFFRGSPSELNGQLQDNLNSHITSQHRAAESARNGADLESSAEIILHNRSSVYACAKGGPRALIARSELQHRAELGNSKTRASSGCWHPSAIVFQVYSL